ncbi:MAG TPA: MBOAT family O-acyltransferase [Candidatus Udaeobacter sp.]|jgi:D-alanyl-lipoteichoic acid acyltransferase DltB (MBOAT superfamily)|nr:MBOAT family O-acyltransferase [Candidatus Udaeobacter sp.]
MLFNSFQYWIFFFIVAGLFYSVPFRFGKILLLLASYVFYMWWDPRFIVLILTSTIVDYYLGIFLETAAGRRRKLLLIISLVVNLGILGFFKYYDFFAGSLAALLRIPPSSVILQIVLPVGVSFYTFASLSYTFDVYWGKMKAVRNPIDYAFFIAFFPHLIAGPIIRARQFISQIQFWRHPAAVVVQSGIILVVAGLIKKMVFADRFAVIADRYFNNPGAHPGWLAAWSGCLAFIVQVYFDFSGYTDIARGCAKLLGFEFPLNFERPLLARNPPDLWQRWHMTLSLWVRDYVFMPLSRGRKRRFVLYRNLVFVMILVGLWHGANWTFVAWGAYWGVLLVGYRFFDRATAGTAIARVMSTRYFLPFSVGLTLASFVISAAFFRSRTLQASGYVFSALFGFHHVTGEFLLTTGTIALIFISLFLAVAQERTQFIDRLALQPARVQVPVYVCAFLVLELFPATGQVPFVYFQF